MGIQKFEYLENKNSFLDEIKSIFYNYLRSTIWWKNKEQQTQALNTGSHILPTFFPIYTTRTGLQAEQIFSVNI